MRRIVFYSWQSDLIGKGNRNIIQDAILGALRAIKKDKEEHLDPVMDRDTSGINGTPSISESIFNKITLADVFIADVSIINSSSDERKTANPNVLIELGFAVSQLGWDRVILIQNTHYGSPEHLPFDLRGRRVITYTMNPLLDQPAGARNLLQGRLEHALKEALSDSSRGSMPSGLNAPIWWGKWDIENFNRSFGGSLFVREVSSSGFLFDISVYNGSHMGQVSGQAVFVSRDTAYARLNIQGEDEYGELSFRRSSSNGRRYIKIEETVSCHYWRGMGVSFDGDYRGDVDHAFHFGYMNESDIQRLYLLMGQHYFKLKMNMDSVGPCENLDDFFAEAYWGGVRGLNNCNAAIVMKDDKGSLWAAYADDNEIRYFTNVLTWKNVLPKTIEGWMGKFEGATLIFNSEVDVLPPIDQC